MKSAREMFEELGYELDKDFYIDRYYQKNLVYKKKDNKYHTILFNLDNKTIMPNTISTVSELQAINKQIEELNWE